MINNRYTILNKLGEGRSKVFCCTDKYARDAKFAMKVLAGSGSLEEEMFRDEYRTLKRLSHPYIIKPAGEGVILRCSGEETSATGVTGGSRFFVMEYFEGQKITEAPWVKEQPFLNSVITQICSVLLYLHNSNFIYNDLKAENILVRRKSGKPEIRFIDFGLARNLKEHKQRAVTGTFSYLAPEVLQGKEPGIQSDLFSLGVLLYRIVYGRFPFEGKTESEILKSIISDEPEFEQKTEQVPSIHKSTEIEKKTGQAPSLQMVINKLLAKNPEARYGSAVEFLEDLKIDNSDLPVKEWSPAKVTIERPEKTSLHEYINNPSRYDILLVRGAEGSGKTTLLESIASDDPQVILVNHDEELISSRRLLEDIIFHPYIYNNIESRLLGQCLVFLEDDIQTGTNVYNELKLLLIKISTSLPLKILFDDFNRYDTFTKISLVEIFLILQSKKSKVIIADTSCDKLISENIFNFSETDLPPFSSEQIDEFFRLSLPSFYPVGEIRGGINDYWDLSAGGVYNFLKSLYENEVLELSLNNVTLKKTYVELGAFLPEANEHYSRIFEGLSEEERSLLELCSMITRGMGSAEFAELLNTEKERVNAAAAGLSYRGILKTGPGSGEISFTSQRFREYVYSQVKNRNIRHVLIAEYLESTGNSSYIEETAHQYEQCGNYEKSFDVLWERVSSMKDSPRFQKELLLKISEFPLPPEKLRNARLQLCRVLQKLNENRLCADLINKYQAENECYKSDPDFTILLGVCLIDLGEPEQGRQILENLSGSLEDEQNKLMALLYLAYAHLDLGMYNEALDKCSSLISMAHSFLEYSAKGFNLLGLLELYYRNDLVTALREFETALDIFRKAELPTNIAAVELNIGNVYNMQGNLDEAEQHWKNSLSINSSIGNLDQEAKLLLNLGVFYFDKSEFSNAIKQYTEAQFIFSNLGNRLSEGLTYSNLGEICLVLSKYSEALKSLKKAKEIFTEVNNVTELVETEFLLGRCYFKIGDSAEVSVSIENIKSLINGSSANDKHKEYLRFLEEAQKILKGDTADVPEALAGISESFYSLSGLNDFIMAVLISAGLLIDQEKYEQALEVLNDSRLIELTALKVYPRAERELLLSRIPGNIKAPELNNKFELLNNAYSLIEDQEVNETTWKVLYLLAEAYFERGNINKAGIMKNYAEKALLYIADQIEDTDIREKYLSLPGRKKALERLRYIQRQI